MRTIAFINAKGGVGKTTSTRIFADILAQQYKKRVLVIDLDTQLNTSKQFGVYEESCLCVAHLLVDKEQSIKEVIKTTQFGVDVIPCDKGLDVANQQALMDTSNVLQLRLKKHIKTIKADYDFCLLDCPTSIKNVSTINGLAFTDDVLIPITADEYSLEGINDMQAVINDVAEYNDNISLKGVFITQWENTRLGKEVEMQLKNALPNVAFNTHIRKAIKMKESTFAKDESLLEFAKNSTAVADYVALVKEYLERL